MILNNQYIFLYQRRGVTFNSLLVTRCKFFSLLVAKNHSLLVAEIARCKQSLVTCRKIRSLFVAEVARCKKLFVSRYGKKPGTNVYLKPIKIEEFYLFILYCLKTNKDSVDN